MKINIYSFALLLLCLPPLASAVEQAQIDTLSQQIDELKAKLQYMEQQLNQLQQSPPPQINTTSTPSPEPQITAAPDQTPSQETTTTAKEPNTR